jgi:L-ascorbate metabolism protein UlaG (beta-lactamase superfamily)
MRWMLRGLGGLVLLLAAGAATGCCVLSVRGYSGPPSDHFDGEHFRSRGQTRTVGAGDLLRWLTHRDPGPWSSHPEALPGPPPPRQVGQGALRVTFIGHATLLYQLDGVNVLSDPIYSERASPVGFAGPKRVRPPGIRFDDLPPIHAVIVSHNHYDHLDLPTLKRLKAAWPDVVFIVPLGNSELLRTQGLSRVVELDWWGETSVKGLKILAVPSQHGSNRGLCDQRRALWAAYILRGEGGGAYFGGDTGLGPHFEEVRRRVGPVRFAGLPIGAFRPEWFMHPVHMSPAQAVQAQKTLDASTAVAIHFGTFPMADDGELEPVQALESAFQAEPEPKPRFWVLGFGEGRDVPAMAP